MATRTSPTTAAVCSVTHSSGAKLISDLAELVRSAERARYRHAETESPRDRRAAAPTAAGSESTR